MPRYKIVSSYPRGMSVQFADSIEDVEKAVHTFFSNPRKTVRLEVTEGSEVVFLKQANKVCISVNKLDIHPFCYWMVEDIGLISPHDNIVISVLSPTYHTCAVCNKLIRQDTIKDRLEPLVFNNQK